MYAHRILIKRIHKKLNPIRYNQIKEVDRWYKDGGDIKLRYTYPLHKESTVIDAGGYEGEWTYRIYDKYNCNIYVFEPIYEYYKKISRRFKGIGKIRVVNAGLGGEDREEKMSIEDVTSSTFKKSRDSQEVKILDMYNFCKENDIKDINLVKINIEGGEYELLERIIDSGLIKRIDYIQVQFHNFVPNAEKRMEAIQRKLSKTHRPTYQYWFVWENWIKK